MAVELLKKVMQTEAETQLLAMLDECRKLEAEVRFHPQHRCFTVMVWSGWDYPDPYHLAEAVQMKVRALAKQYPFVVCYCFDEFSTLVYIV